MTLDIVDEVYLKVIPAEACGLQDDVILLCLASSTTPRQRNLLTALSRARYFTSGRRRQSRPPGS